MTLIATCFSPAKNIPSPTSDSKSKYFSSSDNLKVCWTRSTDVGDCCRRSWIEEFVIIGMPYGEFKKSETSWVMVEMPRKYLRPRFAMPKRNEAVSSLRIIHHASSMTSRRLRSSFLTVFQMWCVMMYIATGFRSSSMSRTEKTTSFLFMSTLVGRFMNPDHVPFVYLESLATRESEPSMPESTSSKSERSGGSTKAKFASCVMSFKAYVSVMALSIIASSSGVRPPSMMRKRPTSVMMLLRSTSPGFSSSRGIARSNGLMWCSEESEILKYRPPTVSARYSYSRSGSMTMTSVSNMRERRISSLVVYDLPAPGLAKVTEL